jgi:hypothetical protein
LHEKDQLSGLQQKISAYMKTDAIRKEAEMEGSDYLTYHLEPFTRVHLYSSIDGFEPNGSITYIYVLGIIALLILMIACVNYTNLAISAISRPKRRNRYKKSDGRRQNTTVHTVYRRIIAHHIYGDRAGSIDQCSDRSPI